MKLPLRERDEFDSHYEDRVQAPVRARGTLPAAGVYLVRGAYEVAAHHSPAERRLLQAGALRVASVTFDGAQVAALTGGGARDVRFAELLPVPARAAARAAEPPPGIN